MTRLQRLARIVRTLVKHPTALKRVISDPEDKREYVQGRFGLMSGLPRVDLLELVPELRVTVTPYSFLEGTSSVIDLALLNELARRRPNCRYLEIGTWRGESLANVARFAARSVSISLSESEMRDLGLSDGIVGAHKFFSKDLGNVEHIAHDSRTFDYGSLGEKFDLVFIDADHSYDSVRIDTRNAFQVLKDENSVIVWHDYGETPETVRWDVLAGILDGCPEENRKHLYHVSNTLCAIFTKSTVQARVATFPETPDKNFEITIRATPL